MTQTAPQNMIALDQANTVRLARAATKRDIASGKSHITDVLLECQNGMLAIDAVLCVKQVGPRASLAIFAELGLSPAITLGQTSYKQNGDRRPATDRERRVLAAYMGEREERRAA